MIDILQPPRRLSVLPVKFSTQSVLLLLQPVNLLLQMLARLQVRERVAKCHRFGRNCSFTAVGASEYCCFNRNPRPQSLPEKMSVINAAERYSPS